MQGPSGLALMLVCLMKASQRPWIFWSAPTMCTYTLSERCLTCTLMRSSHMKEKDRLGLAVDLLSYISKCLSMQTIFVCSLVNHLFHFCSKFASNLSFWYLSGECPWHLVCMYAFIAMNEHRQIQLLNVNLPQYRASDGLPGWVCLL